MNDRRFEDERGDGGGCGRVPLVSTEPAAGDPLEPMVVGVAGSWLDDGLGSKGGDVNVGVGR